VDTEPRPIDALIVIDMQNAFCHPDGSMYDSLGAPLHEIEPVVRATAEAVARARSAGLPVVFTRHRYLPGHADFGPLFPQFLELLRSRDGLLGGTWDTEVIDELGTGPADLMIDKSRLDAFHGTSLDTLLRSLGVHRPAVAGVITNACVETTVRAAAMRDYTVTLLADCITSGSAEHRAASLTCLQAYQLAEVVPWTAALPG
jgi:nicotinamidase-related amidase